MSVDKIGTISFRYFVKGDYVRTGNGVGVVLEDEKEIHTEQDLRYSEVLIQHKRGWSNNAGNRPYVESREMCIIISKEEYDKEKS